MSRAVLPFSPHRDTVYNRRDMDNFTVAVLIGDALVVISLIVLILLDKGTPKPTEAPKPAGKRSA